MCIRDSSKSVMNEKPRPKDEGIMTKDFITGIGIEGLVIGINTIIAFYMGLNISLSLIHI